MRAFLGFVRKETLHLLRDRQTLAILILFPVVQVLIFGFAVRTDVRDIAIAIVDPTPDVATQELRERIAASDRFRVVWTGQSAEPLALEFRDGTIRQALVLPREVERKIGRGDSLPVQLITDGSDPNTAGIMMGYASAIVNRWYRDAVPSGTGLRIDVPARMRYNPTLESAHLFVPGLVAFVLTIVSALMTAISITREKETGTMEMLLVSPIRPKAIVAGKVMPYIVLGFVSVLLVLVAARTVFGVPLRGSLTLLLAESVLYIVTALALGILISTKVPNQRTAMIAALAGLMMPTLLLSGFIFPLDSLPKVLQWLSYVVPARWFLTIVRGIMLKGAGLATLWQETLILIGMTLFLLVKGSRGLAIRLGRRMRTIFFLVRKEFLQIFRDRTTVFQIFMIPVVQLLVLANAATFDVKQVSMLIVDEDHTTVSSGLVQRMEAGRQFRVVRYTSSDATVDHALLDREVTAVLHVPRRFEEDLVRHGHASVQLVLNAEEGATAGIVQSYAGSILSAYAQELSRTLPSLRRDPAAEPRAAPLDLRTQRWFNPTRNYKYWMVPALMVSLTTIIGLLLTAQNITRENELGTLEQLNVTPMTKVQFIAAKLIPFWILSMVIFSIGLAIGKLVFGIPMRGNLLIVYLAAAVYLIVVLGMGLGISTITRTQQQSMFVAFFFTLIFLLMSGLFTPVDSMPDWAQTVAEANPVKHFVSIMRAVLMRGAGLETVARPIIGLGLAGLAVLGLAVLRYRKSVA